MTDAFERVCLICSKLKGATHRLAHTTSFWYVLVGMVCLASFAVLNRYGDGVYFDAMFYQLINDAHLDFFVFLVGPSLDPMSYLEGEGINPPLVKFLMGWVSGSMPLDMYEYYASETLQTVQQSGDIRGNAYASLPFLLMCVTSLAFFSIAYFHYCEGGIIKKGALTFLALTSVGVLFALERGNIILIAAACLTVFIFSLQSKDAVVREIGLVCYGIATAIKIYPAIFVLLLWFRGASRGPIIRALLYAALLTMGPFVFYGGIDGFLGFASALFGNASGGVGVRPGSLNGTSIACTLFRLVGMDEQFNSILPIVRGLNYAISLLLIGLSKILGRYWKQVLALTLAMLMLPGSSSTYMAIFVLPSLLLFLNDETRITIKNLPVLLGYVCMTVVFPLVNNGFVDSLRNSLDVPNRLTALMLLNEFGEIVLISAVFALGLEAIWQTLGEHLGKVK